jgi:Flp pilus assembly protein TadG
MLEFGRMAMVQQILTNASREGARRGILEHATVSDVEAGVTDYLQNTSVSGATVTVDPDTFAHIGFGDPVTVTVSVPYAQVSWVPVPRFLGGSTLTGQSVMRAERPE